MPRSWFLNANFHDKEPGFLEDLTDYRAEPEKPEMSLVHLGCVNKQASARSVMETGRKYTGASMNGL